jgi:hypothetical protein
VATSALPQITGDIALLRGPSTTIRRDLAAPTTFRILDVAAGATLRVRGIAIQNGSETTGGGILNAGTVILDFVTLNGNTTTRWRRYRQQRRRSLHRWWRLQREPARDRRFPAFGHPRKQTDQLLPAEHDSRLRELTASAVPHTTYDARPPGSVTGSGSRVARPVIACPR